MLKKPEEKKSEGTNSVTKQFPAHLVRPALIGLAAALAMSAVQLALMGPGHRMFNFYAGNFTVIMSVALFWPALRWRSLLVIPIVAAIDIDHFLFQSGGFFEHPESGVKILHAFHSVEMMLLLGALNAAAQRLAVPGRLVGVVPSRASFNGRTAYFFASAVRLLTIGTAVHYLMDIFIYTYYGKWGFYDYSVISHFLK